jgi:hypothetical protein
VDRKKPDCTAHELFEKVRIGVDRVDLLASFLAVLAKPVPKYEPEFRHVPSRLSAHEIRGGDLGGST